MNKRIFFALNFPSETKKEIQEKYGKKLDFKGIKKVEQENIHITLLFLGQFAEEKIEEIKRRAEKIEHKKIKVKIKGIDEFNSRIIFLKIEEGEKEITELHEKICDALKLKDERFKVHATIARNKKTGRKEFENIIKKLKKTEFKKEIEVKSFELMESVLSGSEQEYKKIFSVKLL